MGRRERNLPAADDLVCHLGTVRKDGTLSSMLEGYLQ